MAFAFAAVALLVLWLVTLARVNQEKSLVLENSQEQSHNIGAIVAANLEEVVRRGELYVRVGQSLLDGERAPSGLLNPLLSGEAAYLRISIYDAHGVLRHSSANRREEPELTPAVHAFMAAGATDRSGNALHLGQPAAGPGSTWRVPLVMAMPDMQRQPGYFAAIIDLGYFLALYKNVALGEGGRIEILGRDGYQFAELSDGTLSAGRNYSGSSYAGFSAGAAAGRFDGVRPGDTARSVGIYRALQNAPLTVMVSRDRDVLLGKLARQHRNYLLQAVFVSIVFLCLSLGLGYLASRRHRLFNVLAQSEQEKRSLIAQLESEKSRALQLASHDYLTGIPNRMLFYELAANELARARRSRKVYACLFLDLDKFKLINDTLGHGVGDRLLQEAAARLRANLREYDLLARLGGDEFVMLVSEIASEEAVANVAAKLVEAICQPFLNLDGHDVETSPSIGIALYPRDGQDVETLLTHADATMYTAKQAGSATYRFFDASLNASSVLQNELLARFRRAIKEEEFRLHFQPRVSLQDYRVSGLDALEGALGMPVEIVQPSSYGAVIESLLAGAVDVARLGPASYVAAKRQDARITAFASYASKREVFQEEGAHYHSLLIVRRDSAAGSIEALRGKRLALVDPDSTSGALIPRRAIGAMVKGSLESHFSRVSYSGAHHLSALAVVNGQVDAAFVGSTNLSELVAKGQAKPEDFRILWRSAPIPRDPFVFREQLCADIRDKIRAVFLRDHGRGHPDVLNNLKAVRFVPIGDSDYPILRDLS